MKKVLFVTCITLAFAKSVFATGVIDIAYSPFTINNPGSYIVVKDLTTALNLDCIDINTSNVTIDLNGHSLFGAGSTGNTSNGIHDLGYFDTNNNVIIKNGNLDGFGAYGILLYGNNTRVTDLNIQNCGGYGIYVFTGTLEHDNVSHCCSVSAGYQIFCDTGSILNSQALYSSLGGGIGGEYLTAKDNITGGNHLAGIYADDISDISRNRSQDNTGDGIESLGVGSLITNNVCEYNANGINAQYPDCLISNNVCTLNSIAGIQAVNRCNIRDNTVAENQIYGIVSQTDCQVVGNMISYQISSSGYGIYQNGVGTRIDNNHITSCNVGIYFTSATNWYGRNTFSYNLSITGGTAPSDPGSPYTNETF